MESLIKVSVVLMLCEIGSAKDLLKYIQGNNATVYLDELQTDVNATLEINFSGYTSDRHFTNVMIYNLENGKERKVSINSNYTGRIQRIVMSNGNLSFLLLDASFNDSGKYTARLSSVEKRNTSVFVVGRILSAYPGERITHSFIFSETTTSSIKIEFVTSRVKRTALFYNVSKGDCNSADVSIVEDIEVRKCERKTDEFSFTFPNITWLHKGGYFACDEKGRLLDSIFIDVDDMDKASPSISNSETVNPLLYVVLGIGGIITAFLAYLRHKFRIRLRVDRTSNINTFKDCNKDDEEDIQQEENPFGGYLTVISNERGEFSTAIELEFVQGSEAPLFGQNVVPAKNESENSMKLDSVQGDDALDGYLNPIPSCSVEFDEYINPISSCSVESDEYIRPIDSSPVNSGFVSTSQSTEF